MSIFRLTGSLLGKSQSVFRVTESLPGKGAAGFRLSKVVSGSIGVRCPVTASRLVTQDWFRGS